MGTSGSRRTDRTRYVVATVAVLVGLIWVLQGIGALPGSFMSDDMLWARAGLALVVVAVGYGAWPRLRRR